MSSDYLDYELSKELHDLGVVFGKPTAWWDSTVQKIVFEPEDYMYSPITGENESLAIPSTARLIDELRKYSPIWITLFTPFVRIDLSETKTMEPDDCATTALGKALIALVKKGK